ncbi:hypothetical protein LCGC14_2226900, partial [marine sediment metagenome]
ICWDDCKHDAKSDMIGYDQIRNLEDAETGLR